MLGIVRNSLLVLACFLLSANASHEIRARQSASSLPSGWEAIGCFSDSSSSRTLKIAAFADPVNMTIESCIAFCTPNGYQYAGVEFSRECYCDNLIESPGSPIISGCNMPCVGNLNEICGGSNAINIFSLTTPPAPPSGWASIGCFSDVTTNRTLRTASFTSVEDMTIEACAEFCTPAGYQYSGVEFGRECYCDNVIEAPGAPISSGCNIPCTGNAAETCGGAGAINIFSRELVRTINTFEYRGCFKDTINGNPRSLSHQLTVQGGVSVSTCTAACKAAGFPLAGVEFGQECWCDNYMEIVLSAPDSDCSTPCAADGTQLCGAGNRLAVYQDTSVPSPDSSTCLPKPVFEFILELSSTTGTSQLVGVLQSARVGQADIYALKVLGNFSSQELSCCVCTSFELENNFPGFSGTVMQANCPSLGDGSADPLALVPNGNGALPIFQGTDGSRGTVETNFCAQPDPSSIFGPFIGPPLLSIAGNTAFGSSVIRLVPNV